MKSSTFVRLAALAAAILLQIAICKTIPIGNTEKPEDKYVQEAADAIDSTLLSFKNGFFNFMNDSSRVNDFFTQMSNSIGKYVPKSENLDDDQEKVHNNLKELTMRANKTLMEKFNY